MTICFGVLEILSFVQKYSEFSMENFLAFEYIVMAGSLTHIFMTQYSSLGYCGTTVKILFNSILVISYTIWYNDMQNPVISKNDDFLLQFCFRYYWEIRSKSFCHFARYLPDAVFGLYFQNGGIVFPETWYVTSSDSTPSPLRFSANSMKCYFHYGLKHNEIFGKKFMLICLSGTREANKF